MQTIQNRHTALLQKAQEELEGNTSNELSLKATLTDQIKEQENTLASVKEVKFWFSIIYHMQAEESRERKTKNLVFV